MLLAAEVLPDAARGFVVCVRSIPREKASKGTDAVFVMPVAHDAVDVLNDLPCEVCLVDDRGCNVIEVDGGSTITAPSPVKSSKSADFDSFDHVPRTAMPW